MRQAISTYQHQRELYETELSAKESALHQKTVSLESLQKQVQAVGHSHQTVLMCGN